MLHPEAGHVLVAPMPGDPGSSVCPFHSACLEGLASGPSIQRRWGSPASELTDRDDVWELESDYLAQALANYVLCYSPQRIVLGGGVMNQAQLFPLIRRKVTANLARYIRTPELEDMESYVVPSSLNGHQGILGCLELGRRALEDR